MKCPNCGKWNKAGMPHCIICGARLEPDAENNQQAWVGELHDQPRQYISVDDRGQAEAAYDKRDLLAGRMADLRERKQEGRRQMQQIVEHKPRTPGSRMQPDISAAKNREEFYAPLRQKAEDAGGEDPSRRQEHSISAPYARQNIPSLDYRPADDSERMRLEDEQFYESRRYQKAPRRHKGWLRKLLPGMLVTVGVLVLGLLAVKVVIPAFFSGEDEVSQATITSTIRNDLATHTVTIPGEEGQRITIRELRSSAIVVGGVATFDIPDHVWYDSGDDTLGDSMQVTLTPYITLDNGKQKALPKVEYEISVPLSPIELESPDNLYTEVSTVLYNIVFYVREGSTVTINDVDYSDLVNTGGGKVSYNVTVQPIGENHIKIVVHSQYCRKNSLDITLYRAKQEIPLDLASDVATSTTDANGAVTIKGTTLPGAVVKVLSPHTDLDITDTSVDGSFSFVTRFDTYGNNTVIITADYPGKATTRVEHVVYWVPNIDVYSRKAWDIVSQYTDLMDNIDLRKKASQIYVCKGIITSIDTTKPQRAFMNVGTDESPVYVYLENSTKTTWEEGTYYRVYADAYGTYDSKPWLIARYTYTN